jgi:hypothetical protein
MSSLLFSFPFSLQTIISTTSTLNSSQTQQHQQSSSMGAQSNGSKTAHSKVANGTNAGASNNTNQTTTSKRSSSGADGDYQLVQHEVLYSQSSQYEVSDANTQASTFERIRQHKPSFFSVCAHTRKGTICSRHQRTLH